jgi:hypothetical protein
MGLDIQAVVSSVNSAHCLRIIFIGSSPNSQVLSHSTLYDAQCRVVLRGFTRDRDG